MQETRKIWKLISEIQQMPAETVDEIFRIRPADTTIYTSLDVLNELRLSYSSYNFVIPMGTTDQLSTFISAWTHYQNLNMQQLARAYDAITAEYDPITNYDMHESSADGRRLSKETDTSTPTGGTHTETQLNRYGLGSGADGSPADTTTTDVTPLAGTKTETTKEFDNDKQMSYDGETLTGYHETNEHFMQRSGNIGVMTASDMILREMSVRRIDLLQQYIKRFIDRYCFVIGGDDE